MSLFGKLLLGVQLVLSVCFLALAGAVYSTQTTFKEKYELTEKQLVDARQQYDAAVAEKAAAETARDTNVAAAENDRDLFKGQLANTQARLDAAIEAKNLAEANYERERAVASVTTSEAEYRKDEAITRRTVNSNLSQRLEQANQRNSELQDKVFTATVRASQLEQEYEDAAAELAQLRRTVGRSGTELASVDVDSNRPAVEPPPAIDGLIKNTREDKTGRVDLVEISVGSDDGLKKGQRLDAYRGADNGQRPKYLGKIELVAVYNDSAVARVINATKSGIIERGDRVTSQL